MTKIEINLFLDDDHDWIAAFASMPAFSAFGATKAKALAEFLVATRLLNEAEIEYIIEKSESLVPLLASFQQRLEDHQAERMRYIEAMEGQDNYTDFLAGMIEELEYVMEVIAARPLPTEPTT